MASRDPYYIVKDEVSDTVWRKARAAAQLHFRLPCHSSLFSALLVPCLQLRGVQAKFGKWQTLPRSCAERKALRQELEEDCQSLEYMVRCLPLPGSCGPILPPAVDHLPVFYPTHRLPR